jgi:hypothetical protein
MENNFNFINFSFFEIDSLTAMKEAVREVFIQDFQKGKANFIKTPFIISEFIDPSYGGKHDDVFCCWQVSHYPNKIFFISNSGDGRITLCNVLRLKLHCSFYQFALSNDNASPFFLFHHSSKQGITRDVLKDNPTVVAAVKEGVISLTGEIKKSDLPKLLQKVSALKPVKIDNQLIIK